jgi:hypothetical protein
VLSKSLAKQEARHFEPLAGEKSVYFGRRLRRLLTFSFSLFLWSLVYSLWSVWKNKPNFPTTKYALSISKPQKRRPKNDLKKRNKPNLNRSLIFSPVHLSPVRLSRPAGRVDNFDCPLNAVRCFNKTNPMLKNINVRLCMLGDLHSTASQHSCAWRHYREAKP